MDDYIIVSPQVYDMLAEEGYCEPRDKTPLDYELAEEFKKIIEEYILGGKHEFR